MLHFITGFRTSFARILSLHTDCPSYMPNFPFFSFLSLLVRVIGHTPGLSIERNFLRIHAQGPHNSGLDARLTRFVLAHCLSHAIARFVRSLGPSLPTLLFWDHFAFLFPLCPKDLHWITMSPFFFCFPALAEFAPGTNPGWSDISFLSLFMIECWIGLGCYGDNFRVCFGFFLVPNSRLGCPSSLAGARLCPGLILSILLDSFKLRF